MRVFLIIDVADTVSVSVYEPHACYLPKHINTNTRTQIRTVSRTVARGTGGPLTVLRATARCTTDPGIATPLEMLYFS